jgi:gamma-glutamylputrescine oxidase
LSFNLSFWERSTFVDDVDVCIIGSGLVGLHAAIAITAKKPGTKVLILERGFLPYGASTRNAGVACFGSMTELLDDLTRESESAVFSRVQMRWEGLVRLRELLGDKNLQYEPLGGYELFTPEEDQSFDQCLSHLSDFNSKAEHITTQKNVYRTADEKIAEQGFNGIAHLMANTAEGQLDTGRMMLALEAKARTAGVRILNGIQVTQLVPGNHPAVHTNQNFIIRPGRVLVTTNGFARQLLSELEVEPARAQVLITQPVNGLRIKGSFHFDKGYYYFRNVGDRILFGGGRNINFDAEATDSFGLTEPIQQRLEKLLTEMILPGTPYEIDMRWSGIMGMGPTREPIIRETGENCYCAVRMGGMGVAIGSVVGLKAAAMILD